MITSLKTFNFLAAGLGSGWLPKAPGTWGSLAALLPAWVILESSGVFVLLLASFVMLAAGCYICMRVLPMLTSKDPGWIVIDEWAGQWLCIAVMALMFPVGLTLIIVSFLMFRLFDILKPWPILWCEQAGPAWWSIMADDLAAGLIGGCGGIGIMYLLSAWTG